MKAKNKNKLGKTEKPILSGKREWALNPWGGAEAIARPDTSGELGRGLCNLAAVGIGGEHQGQRAVAGDIAGGAEAVLEGENGEHQSGAGVIKAHHSHDKAQRGHDGAPWHTGSSYGEDPEKQTEEHHGDLIMKMKN